MGSETDEMFKIVDMKMTRTQNSVPDAGAVLDHRATEKKSRGSRKIWILGTILLLGVMVGGIIALLNQKTDDGGEYEKVSRTGQPISAGARL